MEKPVLKSPNIESKYLMLSELIAYWKEKEGATDEDEAVLIQRLWSFNENLPNGEFYLNLDAEYNKFDQFLIDNFEEVEDNYIEFWVDTE